MDKKLFVLCFPGEFNEFEHEKQGWSLSQLFTDVLKERYIDKGHGLLIVNAQFSDKILNQGLLNLRLNKNDHAEINTYIPLERNEEGEYADFAAVTKQIQPQKYSQIRVGGFAVTDCVHKLSRRIFNENSNTLVDTELTNLFQLHFFNRWNKNNSVFKRNAAFVPNEYDPKRAYLRLQQESWHEDAPAMQELFPLPHFGGVKTQGQGRNI